MHTRVCVVRKGRTPPAKHLLRQPLLNDFTRCASKCQPLAFRGSLCDNSHSRNKGYRHWYLPNAPSEIHSIHARSRHAPSPGFPLAKDYYLAARYRKLSRVRPQIRVIRLTRLRNFIRADDSLLTLSVRPFFSIQKNSDSNSFCRKIEDITFGKKEIHCSYNLKWIRFAIFNGLIFIIFNGFLLPRPNII